MPAVSRSTRTLLFLVLLCGGLYFAKGFLVPIVFAALLAILVMPVNNWLEQKGLSKALSAVLCVLMLLTIVSGVVALLWWQLAGLAQDADQVAGQLNKVPARLQEYIHQKIGIPVAKQQQMIKEQGAGISSGAGGKIAGAAGSVVSMLGTSLLVTVYIFLFVYYRLHLEAFVLRLVAVDEKERTKTIISSSGDVARQYISGLGIMVGLLWVLYGIGFSIIGVKHALFFAVLCGLLEIMPYVGNLSGTLLTAAMAFTQGGSSMALWVLLVYGIIQFTQTYLIEPLVVGARVSINPLCTIVIIVLGEAIWGVAGMILAIPILGIVKIVCDNIPRLQPFGFLIGEVKERRRRVAAIKE